jgi:hypothetical protein
MTFSSRSNTTKGYHIAAEMPIDPASIRANKPSAVYGYERIRGGVKLPAVSATNVARNAVTMTLSQSEQHRMLPAGPPKHVAEKILEAIETKAAEVYADNIGYRLIADDTLW